MSGSDRKPVISYFIFDIETIADGDLVAKIRYPNETLTADEAIAKYRAQLLADTGKDVLPVTFMLPISVAVAKVDAEYKLHDVAVLDSPKFRPHVITRHFWQGWNAYGRPTLVTFNGRGYDVPVMELAAYRYGYSVPAWFNVEARTYEQARNRYNANAHLDLLDLLSNFGASRISGGLNLLANLIGKPGKTGVDGSQVQGMYDAGEVGAINDYCRCDVLDTYFVFLRTRVLLGKLTVEDEHRLVSEAKVWLEAESENIPVYKTYLSHWGDWKPPTDA
ncbi:3'-5' exonuclease [Schlesneria paludicola]|uniref:3'-5' exonuclease n=1 Tax=Schlesneria paludicola TaxID=360056 RepID=UPI00029AC902|nr:3'-5' exonuclease [Schlesneria paludicola]